MIFCVVLWKLEILIEIKLVIHFKKKIQKIYIYTYPNLELGLQHDLSTKKLIYEFKAFGL